MKKDELIKQLIANELTPWTDGDKETLEAFSDEQLDRLKKDADSRQPVANTEDAEANPAAKEEAAATAQPADDEDKETSGEGATIAELKKIADSIDGKFAAFEKKFDDKLETFAEQSDERNERKQLVSHLVANGVLEEDEMAGMSLAALKKLATKTAPAAFNGMGFPALATQADDDDLPPSAPDWS